MLCSSTSFNLILLSFSRLAVEKNYFSSSSSSSAAAFVALKSFPKQIIVVHGGGRIIGGSGNMSKTTPSTSSSALSRYAIKPISGISDERLIPRHDVYYPRPLHPGGFSLPPLVEDRLSIVTTTSSSNDTSPNAHTLQTDLLLVKPTDMESLWEWYAHTKLQHDADPSWGRVWPTALSLSRWILRALNMDAGESSDNTDKVINNNGDEWNCNTSSLIKRAIHSLHTSSHVVEVGSGLGVAGLVYATNIAATAANTEAASEKDDKQRCRRQSRRTITFLDKEPYALHCVMASAVVNGLTTGSILQPPPPPPSADQAAMKKEGESQLDTTVDGISQSSVDNHSSSKVIITARAAVDDWTVPVVEQEGETSANESKINTSLSAIKNVCHRDLFLDEDDDGQDRSSYESSILVLASDILYEPSSMKSLAIKFQKLVHPKRGGFILIADPDRERTPGCRVTFVECIRNLGGGVEIYPMENCGSNGSDSIADRQSLYLDANDIDIDGSLAKTVLIVVHFPGMRIE